MLNISKLCDIAGVSRSGYYRWLSSGPSRAQRDEQDRMDFELILEAYNFRGYAKGARGIYMRLLHMKPSVIMNIKKIRRLMSKYGLKCPIRRANPYRRMAKALKTSNVAPNLLNREFREHGPRKVLLTDITYLPYGDGRHSYLSTVLDAFTKQLLAYVISKSLEVDFVLETVNNLIRDHGISLQAETLINSDQGSHYTSIKFINLIRDSNLRQSMSRRANCWDNAPQECLFGHMKDEIDLSGCDTHEQVVAVIDDWVDYYNNDRYQWELARLSPNEYEKFIGTGIYPIEK
jgi:transposase InsO family protein